MEHNQQVPVKPSKPFFVRKLTHSGGTRYLSMNKIVPPDWDAVKIVVGSADDNVVIIKIECIR